MTQRVCGSVGRRRKFQSWFRSASNSWMGAAEWIRWMSRVRSCALWHPNLRVYLQLRRRGASWSWEGGRVMARSSKCVRVKTPQCRLSAFHLRLSDEFRTDFPNGIKKKPIQVNQRCKYKKKEVIALFSIRQFAHCQFFASYPHATTYLLLLLWVCVCACARARVWWKCREPLNLSV